MRDISRFTTPRTKDLLGYIVGVGSTLAGVGFNFLVQLILARLLGLEQFGQFSVWRNNVQLAAALSGLSLSTLGLKRISELRQDGQAGRISVFRRRTTFIVLGLSLVLGAIIGFLTPRVHPLVTISAVTTMAVVTLWASANRAQVGSTMSLVAERAIQPLLYLIATGAVLIIAGSADVQTMSLYFIGSFGVTLALVLLAFRTPIATPVEHLEETPKAILRATLPFLAISVASFASARVPLLVGAFIFTVTEVGQLAFMLSVSGLLQVLLFSVNMVSGPRIAAAGNRGDQTMINREVHRIRILVAATAVPVALGLYFGMPLISKLAGSDALIVPDVFVMLMVAGFVGILTYPPVIALQMTNGQGTLASLANAAVLTKILALVPLGLAFGLRGAAVAELVQALLMGAGISIAYRRKNAAGK